MAANTAENGRLSPGLTLDVGAHHACWLLLQALFMADWPGLRVEHGRNLL
jgi:hypothetical protein